jgi:hypothetical protein
MGKGERWVWHDLNELTVGKRQWAGFTHYEHWVEWEVRVGVATHLSINRGAGIQQNKAVGTACVFICQISQLSNPSQVR